MQVALDAIVRDKDDLVRTHREESLRHAETTDGLTLVEGPAAFAAPHEIVAAGRRLGSRQIFIATGMRPATPEVPGLDRVPFLTSDTTRPW